ncbi:unnamed protein product [Plutella xylostella]|uniref:(diamondback moth) hypothetical protein n=1 Tax=Plutella xylostella TaxID=51655 RepID=A0A8S4G8Q1_PLUXY|nr:unnamed protein product [Plutella xylostella]
MRQARAAAGHVRTRTRREIARGAGAAGAGGYLALLLIAGASAALSATDSTRHLHIFGWHLQLQENEAILAPHYKECRYYSGRVVDVNASAAMVTECAGRWYGLVQVGEEVFALPPRRAPRPRPAHALRRRDLVLTLVPQQVPVYNLTDDIQPELDYDAEELTPAKARIQTRSSLATHEDFFRTEPPAFRPGSRLWLELAVVADHTMLEFHGDKVQHYILALMNIVTAIFNERSLGANMTIVIRKLYLLQRPDPAVRYADISDALRRVNKWNKRHLLKIEDESSRWDALVWLTRAALGGGPSGLARMNSVCSLNSSAVVHDEGFNSGFVIAHEIGHLLGLHHDDAGACGGGGGGGGGGSVMSSVVRSSLHFTWSPCSRNQFHIKSRRWKCLHSRSAAAGFALGEDGPAGAAQVFGVDHQCRVDFGDGFSVCKQKMEAPFCAVLYCAHRASPATCYSKNQPPLQGTPCKEHHRCMDGECVPEPEIPKTPETPETPETHETPKTPEPPAEGVWGAWSRGGCRADCGYGLRVSRRRCHTQSGVGCHGPSSKVSPCYSGRACGRARDARTDLCRREDAALIPALTDDKAKHCQLWCVNYTGGEAVTFGSLPDGTPCSYDKPYDVCYRGLCLEGSCNSTDPACNWCPRGHCKNYTHSGTRLMREDWSSILDIPEDARRFSLHISSAVPLQVGVRSSASREVYRLRDHSARVDPPRDQDRYFKYDVNIPQSLRIVELGNKVSYFNEEEPYEQQGRLVAGGALLEWKTTDADVLMWSDSQPMASLAVLVAPEGAEGAGEPVHFSLNFSIPYHAAVTKPLENRRRVIRGPCSASCGGGVRLVRQRCSPRQHACKPAVYEPCHTHRCEFSWSPGEWEECSQTCGDEGVQERQLYCVPQDLRLTSQLELMKQQVSPALCPAERPAAARPCNRIPCPVYWQETDWTPCSATCGPGVQTQRVVCPAPHEALCGPRPPARRRRCRLRHRCHRHRQPPTDNTIRACDLVMPELLRGYCKIAYFRKHCGRTCRDVAGT